MLDAKTDLSSYNGAVTLRGRFDTELLEGAEIRFYLNHIGVDIYRDGEILYESSHEKFPDMCGSTWVSWVLPAASPEDVLEIKLYNPTVLETGTHIISFWIPSTLVVMW